MPVSGGVTNIEYDNIIRNIGGIYAGGDITVPSNGLYACATTIALTSSGHVSMYLNNNLYKRSLCGGLAINRESQLITYDQLSGGDVVNFRAFQGSGTLQDTAHAQVTHFPDGEILFTGRQYSVVPVTGEVTPIPFPDDVFDPYGAMVGDVYTVSQLGLYGIASTLRAGGEGGNVSPSLYINGVFTMQASAKQRRNIAGGSGYYVVRLESGDTIELRNNVTANLDGGPSSLQGSANWLSIARLK